MPGAPAPWTPDGNAGQEEIIDRQKKRPGPSGSETRQRPHVIAVRVNAAEQSELRCRADRAGITAPAYLRHLGLELPLPRQRSRPPVEVQVLARLIGQMGKIGSNLNQIAHRMNADPRVSELDVEHVKGMTTDLLTLRASVLRAMGRTN